MNRHELELNKIRGFGRGKPLFLFIFLTAALGICGLPFFSGYVSKTLLHESIIEAVHLYSGLSLELLLRITDIAFLFTGGLTIAYMTKLFITLFTKPDTSNEKKTAYISRRSAIVLGITAALLPIMGCFTVTMETLADWGEGFFHGHTLDHAVHYFTWANLKGAVISLTIGAAVYIIVIRGLLMKRQKDNKEIYYADIWPLWLDIEKLIYRPLAVLLLRISTSFAGAVSSLPEMLAKLLLRIGTSFAGAVSFLPEMLAKLHSAGQE